jgi:hypothetical protein
MAKKKKLPSKKSPIQKKSTPKGKKKANVRQKDVKPLLPAKRKITISKKSPEKSRSQAKPSKKDLQKLFEADLNKLASREIKRKAAPEKPRKASAKPRREVPEEPIRKRERPAKVTKPEKGKKPGRKPKEPVRGSYKFDGSKPILDIDLDRARKSTIRKNKQAIYNKRSQLKKKLENARNDAERNSVMNEIYRTSRWMEKANERLGKAKKKKGFTNPVERISPKVIKQNEYLWEAHKTIDRLIDSGNFKTFVINGRRFKASQVMDILEEFELLEEAGALDNDYYMEIIQNSNTGEVIIGLPEPGEEEEGEEENE